MCELWAHYECTGLVQATLEAYETLISSGDCDKPFKCSSCKTALNKFNADLNAMKVRMSNLESKQEEAGRKIEAVEVKQVATDTRITNLEEKVQEVVANSNSSKDVWEELKERERRETNLIIHNVIESTSSDKSEREARDLSGLQMLFNLLDVKLEVSDAVKFIRREGEKRSEVPRPLKVVLRRKEDRDLVLTNSFKLSRHADEHWRKISVVSDLTKLQRKDEADLRILAASKNLERSKEEVDKGQAWKVVGKRGNKRMQMVQLHKEEMVSETGEVRLKERTEGAGKRIRSPGQSPSRPKSRQRVNPGEFGDRVVASL